MSAAATTTATKLHKPRIGCQHFKSVRKQIHAENNTTISALCDIIDNVVGIANVNGESYTCNLTTKYADGLLYSIRIEDNVSHGFKDIRKEGMDNPLNMGHIRIGHEDDRESSEFGTGMKKAMIYLSNHAEIYTHSFNDQNGEEYVKIGFDFPEMSDRATPEESYEASRFETIDADTFRTEHPLSEYGSILVLSSLRSQVCFHDATGELLTKEKHTQYLAEEISKKYSSLIQRNIITIHVNGEVVAPQIDLYALIPDDQKTSATLYVQLNERNEPVDVYARMLTKTRLTTYGHYDTAKGKFVKEGVHEHDVASFCKKQGIKELVIESGSVKRTPYDKDEYLHFNHTEFVRDGRSFGSILLTPKRNAGDQNHIYNRIRYDSKVLNAILGIDSKKTIAPKHNLLMAAILSFLLDTRTRWVKLANDLAIKRNVSKEVDSSERELSDTESVSSSSSSFSSEVSVIPRMRSKIPVPINPVDAPSYEKAVLPNSTPIPTSIKSIDTPSSTTNYTGKEDTDYKEDTVEVPLVIPNNTDSSVPIVSQPDSDHNEPSHVPINDQLPLISTILEPQHDMDNLKACLTQIAHNIHLNITFHDFNIHTLHPMIEDLYQISQKLHTMTGVY